MISEALILLRNELKNYLLTNKEQFDAGLRSDEIILGNIAGLENQNDQALSDKIIITLVNIEEESSLKNGKRFMRNPVPEGIEYVSPPVHLNLYVLFTVTLANTNKPDTDYEKALARLAAIIEFFQAKSIITVQNSPGSAPKNLTEEEAASLRLLPELYTLTFEQINHLWGSLGGKQVPFVLYKIRLVKVQAGVSVPAPVIEEIRETAQDTVAPLIDQAQRDAELLEQAGEGG